MKRAGHVLSLMSITGTALRPDNLDRSCCRLEPTTHLICSHVRNRAAPSKITAKIRAAIIATRSGQLQRDVRT